MRIIAMAVNFRPRKWLLNESIINLLLCGSNTHLNFVSSSANLSKASASTAGRIAVVGSGPAAFYCIQTLLRKWHGCTVDVFEKLPVPYGLVRYGVAPDHPEVKNCIHQFEKTVESFSSRFRFFGNVEIGKDLKVKDLIKAYHVVLLAYGSENENRLGIPGERARNCFSARSFVGWYNGHPEMNSLNVRLSTLDSDTAVILGHGNVALDVARMLLLPLESLKKTDITEYALKELSKSAIRRVILVGRRGPLQVSFTTAELREMTKLPECRHFLRMEDFADFTADPKILTEKLERPRRRLTQLMIDAAKNTSKSVNTLTGLSAENLWELRFLLSPIRIITKRGNDERDEIVSGIEFAKNRLVVRDYKFNEAKAERIPGGQSETIDCGLILYSIGYRTVNIEPETLPFDERSHTLKTSDNFARIDGLKGVYGCGWCVTGPRGVLATTQSVAAGIASLIIEDVESGLVDLSADKPASQAVENALSTNQVRWSTWDDWKRIDAHEQKCSLNDVSSPPRKKITEKSELLTFLTSK